MDIECRGLAKREYLYYLDRPAVSDGVPWRSDEMQARRSVMCNVVRDQWRTGEVNVDGWEGGPLSQGQNAAKLCSSRHDAVGSGR